jgi:tetratricopeptide (TPR) repeat protein
VPEIEAPEIELDEDAPQFRRRLALVVVLITLFGATVAYLHEQNSNLEDNAAREAQIQSIRGFGQQVGASTESQFDYRLFVQQQLLQRRQLVAESRQRSTDSSQSNVYSGDSARWAQLAKDMSGGAPEQSNADVDSTDAQLQVAPDEARLTQQVFANKANDYGNKSDSYVALLTVLAVGLFLIGLSLTVAGRGRYLLAIPGVGIAIVCVVWAVLITTGSITKISPNAVDLTAQGLQKQSSSDLKGAIDSYHAAIKDSPSFGPAYARLADAEFENGVTNSGGNQFQSISDPDATRRAIDAGEKAISLGESNPSLLSSIGFFHFTVGDYARAEQLSQQALAGNNQLPVLIFNLGVAQAAQNEKSAARKTYQQGIDVANKENDSGLKQQEISGALTDLEIANLQATSAKDLIQELKGKLVDAEFQTGTDGSDASADNVAVTTDQFRMEASYDTTNLSDGDDLANVWYFRPNGAGGNDPFVQAFSLDSFSSVANDKVTTTPTENGDCLPGGDYRVEVYAGSKLIGSNDDQPFHLADSPIGKLVVEGGEDLGVSICRPESWQVEKSSDDGSLSFNNPADTSQSMLVFSFPLGSSSGLSTTDLQDATLAGIESNDQLTNLGAPIDGTEFLGRTATNTDVPQATRSVVGRLPDGDSERATVSIGDDGVVRIAVLTAANDNDLDLLRSELINSIRFLDVPEPPSGQGG